MLNSPEATPSLGPAICAACSPEISHRVPTPPSKLSATKAARALRPTFGVLPQDLEARKRAPLYQKKQEEEMRAVAEKAAEADIRAQEAEIKFKEAKVTRILVPDAQSIPSPEYTFGLNTSPPLLCNAPCIVTLLTVVLRTNCSFVQYG